jgi:hypothetical protein
MPERRFIMPLHRTFLIIIAAFILLAIFLSPASFASDPPQRLIARIDLSLLALPNVSAWGGGGGISVPIDGTGAGFMDAAGAELGAEIRFSRWLALDGGAAWYSPTLHVDRDMGAFTRGDSRSASVNLRTYTLGMVVTPPKWRNERARVAVGILSMKTKISEVPSSLGVAVDDSSSGIAVDLRGEAFFSENKHWGVGGALVFADLDPSFIDTERGTTDSLQVSGFFLRLGVRGAW